MMPLTGIVSIKEYFTIIAVKIKCLYEAVNKKSNNYREHLGIFFCKTRPEL